MQHSTMMFWLEVKDEVFSEKYHTTLVQNSRNQHSMMFFFKVNLRYIVCMIEKTLSFSNIMKVVF